MREIDDLRRLVDQHERHRDHAVERADDEAVDQELDEEGAVHGRIGAALEQLYGNEPERLEDLILLGHHFSLSARKPKGARYLRAAGDRARATYANDDAIRLYQQALAVLLTGGECDPERLVLYEQIADLCGAAGRRNTAEEHYQSALEGCRVAADCIGEARILRKLGRLLWDAGKRIKAETHYAEAAERLGGVEAPIERAHLSQERGRLAFRMDLVFSFADRISVLVSGALLTEGPPEQVARDPQVKAVYLGEEAVNV